METLKTSNYHIKPIIEKQKRERKRGERKGGGFGVTSTVRRNKESSENRGKRSWILGKCFLISVVAPFFFIN